MIGVYKQLTNEIDKFGKSMAAVAAVSADATTTQFTMMREEARRLGATTAFSASEAAEGLKFLRMAGLETEEAVSSLAPTLALASAGTLGLGEAADIASNVMQPFKKQGVDIQKVADILAVTAASANTDIRQLGQAMKFAAPIAAGLKVPLQDVSAWMGVLGNSGIQATMAGTSVRQVFAQLADQTSVASQKLQAMGIAYEDIDPTLNSTRDVIQRLADANITTGESFAIFGARAANGFNIMREGLGDFDKLVNKIEGSDGAVQQMASTMQDTSSGDAQALTSALKEMYIAIGDSGVEADLRKLRQTLTKFLREATPLIEEALPPLLSLGKSLGALWLAMKAVKFSTFLAGLAGSRLAAIKSTSAIAAETAAVNASTVAKRANATATARLSSLMAGFSERLGSIGSGAGGNLGSRIGTATKSKLKKEFSGAGLKTSGTNLAKNLGAAFMAGIIGWEVGKWIENKIGIAEKVIKDNSGLGNDLQDIVSKNFNAITTGVDAQGKEVTLIDAKKSLLSDIRDIEARAAVAKGEEKKLLEGVLDQLSNQLGRATSMNATSRERKQHAQDIAINEARVAAIQRTQQEQQERLLVARKANQDAVSKMSESLNGDNEAFTAEVSLRIKQGNLDSLSKQFVEGINSVRGGRFSVDSVEGSSKSVTQQELTKKKLTEILSVEHAVVQATKEGTIQHTRRVENFNRILALANKIAAAEKEVATATKSTETAAKSRKAEDITRLATLTEIEATALRANGQGKEAQALEKKMLIMKRTKDLQDKLGISAEKATALAERESAVSELSERRKNSAANKQALSNAAVSVSADTNAQSGAGGRVGGLFFGKNASLSAINDQPLPSGLTAGETATVSGLKDIVTALKEIKSSMKSGGNLTVQEI